jgi:hypothetical protein
MFSRMQKRVTPWKIIGVSDEPATLIYTLQEQNS